MVSKVSSYDGDDAAEGGGGTEEEGERTCLAESGGAEAGGGAEEEGERTCLAEAIDSLLDVKPELNTEWAESVRQILLSTDLSSPIPSTSNGRSSRSSSCWHTTSSWRENHHQHHDKVVAGLEGLQALMFPLSQEQNSSLGFASSLCVCRTQRTQKHLQKHNEIFTELYNSWRQQKQQEQD